MISDEQKQQETCSEENPNQTVTSHNVLEKRTERGPNTHLLQIVDESWLCPTTTQQRYKGTIMDERHIDKTTVTEQEEECDRRFSLGDLHKGIYELTKEQ